MGQCQLFSNQERAFRKKKATQNGEETGSTLELNEIRFLGKPHEKIFKKMKISANRPESLIICLEKH